MRLWSQDRYTDVPYESGIIQIVKTGIHCEILAHYSHCSPVLALYATEKEAQTALESMHSAYIQGDAVFQFH